MWPGDDFVSVTNAIRNALKIDKQGINKSVMWQIQTVRWTSVNLPCVHLFLDLHGLKKQNKAFFFFFINVFIFMYHQI